MSQKDFLDELIEDGARKNSRFPDMVETAYQRRRLSRELAARRESAGISQKEMAAYLHTTQSTVDRIERGDRSHRPRGDLIDRSVARVAPKREHPGP